MKTMNFSDYAQTKQDFYLDAENVADCSTRIKNDVCEIMVHKSINSDDDPDYFFAGSDIDFAIIFEDDSIKLAYDCTWQHVEDYANRKQKHYVSFHIGRGGHFNNPGHLTFRGEEDFQDLLNRCSDSCLIINDDEDGNALSDSEWWLEDTGGNVILQGRDEIEAMTGRLEWDGIYDTDYVTTMDDLSEDEIEAIWKAYKNEEYMSDELKDAICTLRETKRAHGIKCHPANMEVATQDSVESIDVDQQAGEHTRDEWKEDLERRGFCPLSIEKILDEMEYYDTYDTDFFAE